MCFLGALLLLGCGSDDDAGRDGGGEPVPSDDGGAADARVPEPESDANVPDLADAATDAGGSAPGERPTGFMLEGSAEAMDGDDRVTCRIGATIDQLVYDADGGFTGFAIGEAIRNTVVGENGSEFAPLIGGPATLTANADGSVELRWVGDQPDDALQFWLDLEVITGMEEGDGYAGTWRCGPGLLGDPGFLDIDLTAPGSWTLQPL